jgi:3-dehydroquinate synthase
MRSVRFVTTPSTATDYICGPGALLDDRVQAAVSSGPVALIVDERVHEQHGERLRRFASRVSCVGIMTIPGGESLKSFEHLQQCIQFMIDRGLPKHGSVVAVGGGALCDVAALTAMLVRRGVGLVLVPTTLLAQVDAAVGGKNGINVGAHKNIVGGFYHPRVVACDQMFLGTLGARDLVCGIAETIKVFAIASGELLATHARTWARALTADGPIDWTDMVWDALRWKLDLLAEDPYELSSRRLLNYGHAFAHLFEERSRFALSHGEAVLLGMLVENEVSRELDIARDVDALQALIQGLLTDRSRACWLGFSDLGDDVEKLRYARRGHMNLVCLVRPGEARIVDDVHAPLLKAAWARVDALVIGSHPSEAFISA